MQFINTASGLVQTRQFTLQVGQELVQDGGFEADDFAYWSLAGKKASANDFVDDGTSTGLTPYSGTYFAALGQPDSLAYLSQTLPTRPGQTYLLSFWLQNADLGYGTTPSEFLVKWNNFTLTNMLNASAFYWMNLSYVVVATEPSMNLEFGFRNDPGLFALDGVSVVPIPLVPSPVLVVQTNGNGTITPNDNGDVLTVGTEYTLKAIPANNYVFSNWVGGIASLPYTVLSTSSTYTFVMQSNLVLEANFVPNPFIPLQGTFNGLFLNASNVSEASSGFFTLTLTKSGAFSGKIMTAGGTYKLPTTNTFDLDGQVQFTVPTKQDLLTNFLTFNLHLDLSDPVNQQITGTVSDGTWTAALTADRASFNATDEPRDQLRGQLYPGHNRHSGPATGPGGFGWGTLSISPAGLITLKGNLADGTALSQSVSVSEDGRWPFYAAYAPLPAGNGGAVFGWIGFSNQPTTALGGTLYWFRPAGTAPAVYQSGFTNPVAGDRLDLQCHSQAAAGPDQRGSDAGWRQFALRHHQSNHADIQQCHCPYRGGGEHEQAAVDDQQD